VTPDSVVGQNPASNVQYTNKAVDLGLRSNLAVNPATRAVEIQIPLGSYPGRAGFDVPIAISYSSKVHRIKYEAFNPGHYSSSGQPIGDGYTLVSDRFAEYSSAGWTSTVGFPVLDYSAQGEKYDLFGKAVGPDGQCVIQNDPTSFYPCLTIDRRLVRMPDGSTHELRSSDQPRYPTDPILDDYYSVDGARMRYQNSTQTLFMADGSRYVLGANPKYVDRNGNTINSADTLGRSIPYPPMTGTGLNTGTPGDPTYSIQGVGGTINYTFKWRYLDDPGVLTSPQPLQYVADSSCPLGTGSNNPHMFLSDPIGTHTCVVNGGSLFRPVVLYQIVLPTGQSYTFTYNIYGEIDKVVLPTGGYERYEYGLVDSLSSMQPTYAQANRGVTGRYVSANGSPANEIHWQYTGSWGSVSVTAPDNTLTTLSLYTDPSSGTFGYSLDQARAGRTFAENFYSPPDGNGVRQLLRRHLSDWSVTGSNATSQFASAQQNATRSARLTREVEIHFDTGGQALAKTTTHEYDLTYQFSTGVNETATNEYDYVVLDPTAAQTIGISSIPLGVPRSRTEKTYLDATNAGYRDRNLLGLIASVTVKDGLANILAQSSITYDEGGQYGQLNDYGSVTNWEDPQTIYRGNPTTVRRWLDTLGTVTDANAYLATHTQYDQCGSVRNSWDAKGNLSQLEYASSYAYAYPTISRSAVPDSYGILGSSAPLVSTSTYDFNTGNVISKTDANNKTTTFDYTDPLNRLKQVTKPDTGRIRYDYSVVPGDLYVQVLTDEDFSRSIESRQYFDGLGRPVRQFLYEGTPSTPWSVTDNYYDNMGRVSQVSNPYRVNSPSANVPSLCSICTTNSYDSLGRIKSVTTPDSSQVTTSYGALTSGIILGTTVVVTDQAGRKRRSLTDSLGRLVRVDEPDANGNLDVNDAPAQSTFYSYDTLDNLITVTQGEQTRTFVYDSLKRLTSATNPESGVITYQYDANGNITQRTDARGVITSYDYDALNRNTSVVYPSDTPSVTRTYDGATNGLGRLWKTQQTSGPTRSLTTISIYDALGRPKSQSQQFYTQGVWSDVFTVSATYDLSGHMLTQTYPAMSHTISYDYDAAGRLWSVAGNLGGTTQRAYSSDMIYSPAGAMAKEKFGTDIEIYNKLLYNVRGQLAEIRESTGYTGPTDTTWDRGAIINHYSNQAGCWGATCNATDNNGNLRRQEVYIPNSDSFAQFYEYDTLNRLQSVRENKNGGSVNWQQTYVYDRYGNRTLNTTTTETFGGVNNLGFELNTAKNRLYAPGDLAITDDSQRRMQYDAAGNLKRDTYTGAGDRNYDAENRMIKAWGGNNQWQEYTYNADGQRVRRKVDGIETWQVYGLAGELVAEYAANTPATAPQKEYGYRNGQLLITAEVPQGGGNGYGFSRSIAIDHTKVPNTDQTNFPVLISGTYGYLATTANGGNVQNASGYDVIFTSDSGCATKLNYEVESYNATTGAVNYWVKVPSVSHSSDTVIYLCYGKSGITTDQSNKSGVWDTNYKGVWHLSDNAATTSVSDSTAANNGSNQANTSSKSAAGQISKSLSYNGSSDYTDLGTNVGNYVLSDSFTLEAWVNPSLDSANRAVFGNAFAAAGYLFRITTGNKLRFILISDGNNYNGRDSSTLSAGWHHMVGVWSGLGNPNVYIDGVLDNAATVTGGTMSTITTAAHTRIGSTPESGSGYECYFNGNIDEVRSSKSARSADWIKTEYNNQKSPSTFYSVSAASGGAANLQWLVTDQLGTPRMVFDKTGTLANVKRHDYLPFGEEIFAGTGGRTPQHGYGAADYVRQKFTQKERDIETGLDYFGARYFASTQGRFTSPDPLLSSGRVPQPQSWNRYSYVLSRPLSLVDPNGLDWGYATWQDDGHTVEEYRYFDGKIGKHGRVFKGNGRTYSAVRALSKGGSSLEIHADDGSLVRIRNSGMVREVVGRWAPTPMGNQSQENLNASAGVFDGSVPFGRELREGLLGNGGVDTDSPEYRNSTIITAGVVIIPGLLDGEGEAEAIGLSKQLASESQTAELLTGGGRAIIGSGTNKVLFEAPRLAAEYGGEAEDWAKISSAAYKAPDKAIIETHAYKNMLTGRVVEPKSVSSTFPGRQLGHN
jgi:RHS repeat-associated protein